MTRYFNVALLIAMIVAAAAVYDRKYDAEMAAEKVADLRREIEREKDLIQHLKAEWAMLNQPARLQELVARYNAYLHLMPVDSEQIVRVDALPVRPVERKSSMRSRILSAAASPHSRELMSCSARTVCIS